MSKIWPALPLSARVKNGRWC